MQGLTLSKSDNRNVRYKLQNTAGDIMKCERVACCMRRSRSGVVQVCHSGSNGSAHYAGLQTCGSVWMCPVCASKICERRRVEVQTAVDRHLAAGGTILFVTYTLRHGMDDELSDLLKLVNDAHRAMRQGRRWVDWRKSSGLLGTIRALEVTHGANGWHPHIHELYLFSGKVDLLDIKSFLHSSWAYQLARRGGDVNARGVDVRVAGDAGGLVGYLSKAGWGVAEELAKSSRKNGSKGGRSPQRLLTDALCGDNVARVLYGVYCRAFKGRKMLVWSRGLKALLIPDLIEKTDEEIASEEVEDSVVLAVLDTMQFSRLVALDLRAELLTVADGADADAVRLWLVAHSIFDD